MTAKQMIPAVNTMIDVRFESLNVTCLVCDVKSAWGKTRLEIAPIAGEGKQWIELTRVASIHPVISPAKWNGTERRKGTAKTNVADTLRITGEDLPTGNECQNCGLIVHDDELRPIRDLGQRVAAGEPMPSGECPACGALCQPVEGRGGR